MHGTERAELSPLISHIFYERNIAWANFLPPSGFDDGAKVLSVKKKSSIAGTTYKFRLYVADHSPNSAIARANLSTLCEQYLPDRHEIEINDVFREPGRAHDDEVTLTPMLITLEPPLVCRIVGNVDDTRILLAALNLKRDAA